jgi:hypothetical protein
MPYFPTKNLLFVHIPKTGGTSLTQYLSRQEKNQCCSSMLFQSPPTLNRCKMLHKTYLENKAFIAEKFPEYDRDSLKTITIVRNPYHRIISDLFFYRLIQPVTPPSAVFSIMETFLQSVGIPKYCDHMLPQSHYVQDENGVLIQNLTIFKTETLEEDAKQYGFTDFKCKINVTFREKLDYMSFLNDDSIQLIRSYYKDDFTLFHYSE